MSQTAIPLEFEKYLQNKTSLNKPTDLNEVVFAMIPDLDPSAPIDRNSSLPPVGQWVYQQDVDQIGKSGDNAMVYSVVIPGTVAPFQFNAMFLRDKNVPDSCGVIVHKATETKEVGMALTKSLMMQFDGAAAAGNVTIDAETWQIDYSARLRGMDEDLRLVNIDTYGHTAFVDGFAVTRHDVDANKYLIAPGVVYVGGLRVALSDTLVQTVTDKPKTLYIDAYRDGTALSDWENLFDIVASDDELNDYTAQNGRPHYVTKLARINSDGSIEDLRTKGGLQAHLNASDPHTQYTKEQDFQAHLNASDPHTQYAQKSDFEQFAQRSLLTAKDFVKSTAWEAAFTVAGGVVRTACDIAVIVGDRVVTASANETIDTPTLVIGVDYAIYATHDGLLVSSNFTVPDGYTESNSRRIGGFHYGDSEFKTHSFYDLHFRPRARDPRGMVLDMGERFWADIYLTNTTPDLLGTSAYDAQIADGGSAPKVPAMLGGDGAQQYSDYTQFTANELLACYGKRLPNYQEFQMLARGSVSGYVRGSDPVKTLFDDSARSIIGCEQVSGNMWQWGSDVWDRGNGTSGYEWYDITGGYGKMYASHPQGVGASLFGVNWGESGSAGSRASNWNDEPSNSGSDLSSRGLCDPLILV